MNQVRLSVGGLMILVAIFAASMKFAEPGFYEWVGLLIYLRSAILLAATFAARYARSRAWREWSFGFAAVGWAATYLATGGVWWRMRFDIHSKLAGYLFDVDGAIGSELSARFRMSRFTRGGVGSWALASVINFWFTLTLAGAGGFAALRLARRRSDRPRSGPSRGVDGPTHAGEGSG